MLASFSRGLDKYSSALGFPVSSVDTWLSTAASRVRSPVSKCEMAMVTKRVVCFSGLLY